MWRLFYLVLRQQHCWIIKKVYTLNRRQILKEDKKIQALFAQGRALSVPPLRAIWLPMDLPVPLQAGFSVSKKKFRKATERNRIKRLIREAWRLNSTIFRDTLKKSGRSLGVFIIYTDAAMPDFGQVNEAMKSIVNKLEAALNEGAGN